MPQNTPVAVVAGGANGLGAAYSNLAEAVFAVMIADINDAGSSTAEELRAAGHEAAFVRVDVTDEGSTRRLGTEIDSRYRRRRTGAFGTGRSRDFEGINEFTELKHINWELRP